MKVVDKITSAIGQEYCAYITIFLANSFFTVGLTIGAETYYASPLYLVLVRGISTCITCYILGRVYDFRLDFPDSAEFRISCTRGIIMCIQQLTISYSLKFLQASLVYTIVNTGPIIVFILDYFMNKIRVSLGQVVGIVIASVGLLTAINSVLINHWLGGQDYQDNSKYQYELSTLNFKLLLGLLLFVIHILWAYGVLLTKQLKQTHYVQLNFCQGIVLVFVSSLVYPFYPNTREVNVREFVADLLSIGLVLNASALFYIKSLYMTKNSGNVTIIGFTSVILGYGISLVKYGETPNQFGVYGSICILIGLICVIFKGGPK